MYDMYPWDTAGQGDYPPEPLRSRKAPAPAGAAPVQAVPVQAAPAQAVQVALDRRDNGGDVAAAAGQPATLLTPGRTRQ